MNTNSTLTICFYSIEKYKKIVNSEKNYKKVSKMGENMKYISEKLIKELGIDLPF